MTFALHDTFEQITHQVTIANGDCLSLMSAIADGSVDLILCDLPYGVTQNDWDKPIDFPEMWACFDRVAKENAAVALFAQQPFASSLVMSNRKNFRYEWIWKKPRPSGHLDANRRPMRAHESILVFYRHQPTYNPQLRPGEAYIAKSGRKTSNYGDYKVHTTVSGGGASL